MTLLTGKHALVLDAGDGLGAAMAQVLASEGAGVQRAGSDGDLDWDGSADNIEALCAEANARLGALDIVIGPAPRLDSTRPQAWSADGFAALAAASGALTAAIGRAVLGQLQAPGALCLLGTAWGLAGAPDTGLGGGAQAALGPMTKALALEGAARGLRANAIYTGLIDTPAMQARCTERAASTGAPADVFERTAGKVPMGRAGRAQEVARSAAFLVSDRARHVNGITLLVDGGLLYA